MASYKSGFDPPMRPGDLPRGRRLGQYMQTGSVGFPTKENRESDIRHDPRQMKSRRDIIPATRLPPRIPTRPYVRQPSPSPNSRPEASEQTTGSTFGFGRAQSTPLVEKAQPVLKAKSSRNLLRRKQSSIAQSSGQSRPGSIIAESSSPKEWSRKPTETRQSVEALMKSAEGSDENFTKPIPRASIVTKSPPIIPELDRYRNRPDVFRAHSKPVVELPPKLSTQDLPPPTPLVSGAHVYYSGGSSQYRYSGSMYSASPSTRFSGSPGLGMYSRDTTPTSMSSQSPGIIAPLKSTAPRLQQVSPAPSRPTLSTAARREATSIPNEVEVAPDVEQHGLPSLSISVTSSSSNSTIKEDGKTKETTKNRSLSPLPPSPPPRKSSQKFNTPRSEKQESPSNPSQAPAKPVMVSDQPSLAKQQRPALTVATKINDAPTRPSREGTPNVQSQLSGSRKKMPSNLTEVGFSPDRRKSVLPRAAVTSPPLSHLARRSQQPTRLPSRIPSPNPIIASPQEPTHTPSGLGIIPDLRPQLKSSRVAASRTPSPSLANAKPLFGLFGRRTRTANELPTAEIKEKVVRRGPAAGTGHEGYGRYARARSTSAGGLGRGRDIRINGASSSQESLASTRAQDPFLLERMSPVIIAGGGEIVENRNTSSEFSRTESNTSLLLGRPSTDSRPSSKLSHESPRAAIWPSAIPKIRRPSDSSDDGIRRSSLAFRRSIQRLNNSTSTMSLPRPLKFSAMGRVAAPSITSLDASIKSEEPQLETRAQTGMSRTAEISKPKKLEKRPKSPRKWNFFHRSQQTKSEAHSVQVTVAKAGPKPSAVPHYALLDSSDEQQDMDTMDLDDILCDDDVITLSNEELDLLQFGNVQENQRWMDDLHMIPKSDEIPNRNLFSSPKPALGDIEFAQTDLHFAKKSTPVRPSRLPQVGRIPKVISARPETTSPKSFSRPFARLSTVQPLPKLQIFDKDSVGLGPSPPKSPTPKPCQGDSDTSDVNPVSRYTSGDSNTVNMDESHREFLAFFPRKSSEATTNSSGGLSLSGITAVIPEADAELEEDEVWDEYDDLIQNNKVPLSATSSQGMPFQYESYESRQIRKSKVHAKESPTLASAPETKEQEIELPERGSTFTASSVYSGDMSARLREALASIPTPTTPKSFTDFFSGSGDRDNSIHSDSIQNPRHGSQGSSRKSISSSSHSRSLSGLDAIAEQENNSPISQVNLRVGSMTVSKWLTFGHVLFSPAREELMQLNGSTKRHSILVIDGLGNDDWSFYAAETYPAHTFYNLSPTQPLSASQNTSPSFPPTPPNHRQTQHSSLGTAKFPLPSSTFSVVVFRFPVAMPESSTRFIISEAKRVLKPGGYLEMAILDLDMLNMGNRTRRAVRGLKVRIQAADPNINLASASDTVLRCVGKRGFSDLKSCNVGVPVASTIPSATKPSPARKGKRKTRSKARDREPIREIKEELSLADMLKDSTPAGDESITKMVARVGRWWYTRCYENAAGDQGSSIWSDATLLGECEKWNTSLKLVVAYAQKPVQRRRRTNSV
ncbi:hypothetical protein MBM_01544 [Drepanopeziza brunnea f. sp. 'multigermtubi' MB_m1]|uniref:Methyltransferase type 11 domain-containing protein n=1 Tax=Marssonina brunnea f. sp. multigermtubi (strain MB_m1) TaxID=1072389 RepID=K1X6Y2_MARBU|nr:uncharacterized protein MBM_01544 [Drepanopeziza brunnea f. sp. 'multigermtubi' MB_m1]EKD20862.1 hypothetical protein MBM_01544 [Drepanopeziza brunnea f. sp. 'multigermtubi' MB_m1]